MSLTNIERETGINFNEAEDFAIVYTAKESLKRKLDKLCKQFPKDFKRTVLIGDDEEIKSYHINKKYININAPRQYSDEQRKAMKEHGKRLAAATIAIGSKQSRIN
jgi:thiamine monophosphate kinase